MISIDDQLKYAKKRYGINSLEQLKKEMEKVELDIGAFTMPYTINSNNVQAPNKTNKGI